MILRMRWTRRGVAPCAQDDDGPRKKKREETSGGAKRKREDNDENDMEEDIAFVTEINIIEDWQELDAPYRLDAGEWEEIGMKE